MSLKPVILQVLPSLDTGGVERGTVEMVQAIAASGGEALVASAGGRMVAQVERAGGRHLAMALMTKDPLNIYLNAGRLTRLMRRARVDLIHARSRAPAWSAWLASQRLGVPFVTTWHGIYGEEIWGKHRYNSVMARGARVIAASRYIGERIAAGYGVGADRLRLIPRGVDAGVFDPQAVGGDRVHRLAEAWRVPTGAQVVMLPARVTRWKGAEALLEAAHLLARPDVFWVLVGSDQGREDFSARLTRQAKSLGVLSQLRLAGHCEDMPAALLLADVVVNASLKPEPFGRNVIEAQAMSRPVVAFHHGGAAETIADGQTGFLVPPGDVPALAAAIGRALDLPDEARAWLGGRAREAVLEGYTTRAMQQATLAVYAELLAGRASGLGDAVADPAGADIYPATPVKTILVLRLGALGDFVLSFPAFAALRAHHAADRLVLLTTAPFVALAQASPWFDEIRVDTRPGWLDLPGLWRLRRQLRADFVYDLQTSRRSARYFRLAGRPPWSGIAGGCTFPDPDPRRDFLHTVDRQKGQLAAAGVAPAPVDLSWLAGRGPVLAERYALLIPGTSGSHDGAKTWPLARFAELAGILAERGWRPVVVGRAAEAAQAAEILRACPSALDLTGKTSLLELAGLAQRASLAIGGDTGPLHLAAMMGAPTIALFSQFSDPVQATPVGRTVLLRETRLGDLPVGRVAAVLP